MPKPVSEQPPVTVDIPKTQKKPSAFNLSIIATIFFGLFAILITWLSRQYYNDIKDYLYLHNSKFNKFNQQFKALTELAYIFSLYLLTLLGIVFFLNHFSQRASQSNLALSLRRLITDSFEKFLIFIGIYAYIVIQMNKEIGKDELILIANLFLYGRYFCMFGAFLENSKKIDLKEVGVVMTTIVYVILIGIITGVKIPLIC